MRSDDAVDATISSVTLGGAVRRAINPLSTSLTRAAWGIAHRWGPHPPETATLSRTGRPWPAAEDLGPRLGQRTPAGHVPPPGTIPGWNWIPEGYGLHPLLEDLPRWVRLWYRTPFIDRYAHAWMWRHGGWEISGPDVDPGDPAGVREPRRPLPPRPSGRAPLR